MKIYTTVLGDAITKYHVNTSGAGKVLHDVEVLLEEVVENEEGD